MPLQDYVDVRILVNGQPLPEYPDPEESENNDGAKVYYVEAIAGEAFIVRVRLLPGFRLNWAPYLCFRFRFDDEESLWY